MIIIKDKKDCCGCSACYSVCPKNCITMAEDQEGFKYPYVNTDSCVNCGQCEKACPIINRAEEIPSRQKAYVVQHKDEKILKESTSGGAFTAIAQCVIERGGVVFGAAFDADYHVIHSGADNVNDLARFRNSKYVQSDPEDTFREAEKYLREDRVALFSGTPCQIEGLKGFLRKDYDNLIAVDIVCRAVPSPMIWEKYKTSKTNGRGIVSAAFRSKEKYGYEYSQMRLVTKEGTYDSGVESDPYLRAFFSNLSDRPSCYDCQFKKRYRVSDITLWDCFDPRGFNRALDNNRGVTRVLVHSEKGGKILSAAAERLILTEVPPEQAVDGVREMFHSVPMNPEREQFFSDALTMEDGAFFEKYFPDTVRVKAERLARHASEKLGIYRPVKRAAKKIMGKE